jgi:hypothetical protein
MRSSFTALASLALILDLAAVGCGGDPTCKDGCDKARSCSLSTSGLSCASSVGSCVANDNGCAACLVDKTCAQISSGACASACPGYRP